MKTIKIFLASSIVEFEREREQIENFIRNVSDDFEEKHDIKLKPILCENFDPAMTNGRKQEEYNEEIRNSEMVFFIFFTKLGEFTREEFEVAYSHFKEFDKPKIYTYFKGLSNGETMEESLKAFMDTLDNALSHYHSMFSHIDTIKLRILLNIKLNALDYVEIKAEDGYCVIDGKKYLSIDNLPEFFNNGILSDLKKELEETEKKYYELKPHYVENDDEAKRSEYIDIAAKRQRLIDEIDELEKNIFKLSLNISESSSDFDISPRLAEAYRLLEAGEYEKALIVLDTKEIEDECERELAKIEAEEKMLREKKLKVIRRYIKENEARIDILITMNDYKDRFAEIEILYEKITAKAEEYKIELDVFYDYAKYLREQNNYQRAIEVAEKLRDFWENDENFSDKNKSDLYNLLALIYSKSNRFLDAEKLYLKALQNYRELSENNPEAYLPYVVMTCNNLAVLYNDINKIDEVNKLCLEALQISRDLAEKNPEAYLSDVASTCNNLASLYNKINRKDEAEKLYLEALQIRRDLADKNPEVYLPNVALICNNLASLYDDINRKDEAKKLYLEALQIRRDLARENPDAYLPDVALVCNNLAGLYDDINRKDEAEKLYLEALQIRRELVRTNSDAYLSNVASICNNLADFYNKINRKDEAKKLYLEALRIRRELAKNNLDAYLPDVALTCNNLATLYNDINRKNEAENLHLEALRIYRDLADKNPDEYLPKIATVCNNLALIYDDINRKDEAERLYLEALQTYRGTTDKNPDEYLPNVAMLCFNLAIFYKGVNRNDEAIDHFIEALEIAEQYQDVDPRCKQIVEILSFLT